MHDWQPVYKTVTVTITEAWVETIEEPVYDDVPVAVFYHDGYIARTGDEVSAHSEYLLSQGHSASWYTDYLWEQVGTETVTINHPAVTEQQQVIDYYRCSCGDTKSP